MLDGNLNILLIDRNAEDVQLLRNMFREEPRVTCNLNCMDNFPTDLSRLTEGDIDLIIIDLSLSELKNFIEIMPRLTCVPVIILSCCENEALAIQAMQYGAKDYLIKEKLDTELLLHSVRYAVEQKRTEEELKEYHDKFEKSVKDRIGEPGKSHGALKESEQRLSEIIDFLPDATFAINTEGKVIIWNRTIEEMTGLSAEHMVGKGNYDYALPFYGRKRPILIDLVLESDEETEKNIVLFEEMTAFSLLKRIFPV